MVPSVLLLCLPGNIRRWRRAMPRFRSAASRRHPCGRPPVESMYGTYGGGRSSVCSAERSPYENFLLQCHLKQGACFQQAACLGGAHRSAKAGSIMGRPGGKGPQARQRATSPSRQHRRDGRSFLYRNGHGRRPHPVALMARFHAEEDRRARGGIAPAQTSGDLPFQSVVATCSAGRRSVMRPGSRKNRLARESALFFQRRKDGALSCPDCALVRNLFYLMEIIDFWDRGVKTTPVCATRDVFWRRDGLPTSGWPGYSQRWIGQAGRCADTGTRRKRSVPLLAMACLPGNSPSRADFSRRARTPGQEGEPSHRASPGRAGRRRSKGPAMRAATGGGSGRHSLRGPGRPGKQDGRAAHPCGKLATGKNHQSCMEESCR